VAKAVLISAIPPTFMQSERNPDGVPKAVVDGIRDGTAYHRSQFYQDITILFYGSIARAPRSRKASATTGGGRA
jgi:non-heme chloroperoxidase